VKNEMKNTYLFLVLCILPSLAFAQSDCESRLKEIDKRIGSGNYPETNVQLAKQMRWSMPNMCGMANKEMVDKMMAAFEELLPTTTEEQHQVERKKQAKPERPKPTIATAESGKESANRRSLLDSNIEYSATSYLKKPDSRTYIDALNINHAPGMTRYTVPNKKHKPITILRYDKNLVWIVHPDDTPFFEGLRLYQEFALGDGMDLSSHLDYIMRARQALRSPEHLKNLGKEIIEGFSTTHYQKKEPNRGYKYGYGKEPYNITDYWVSDNGILVRMHRVVPGNNVVMEMKNIKIHGQPDNLFVPPPDYEKRGSRISWDEEKQKLKKK
jgi:hypothetical protein